MKNKTREIRPENLTFHYHTFNFYNIYRKCSSNFLFVWTRFT